VADRRHVVIGLDRDGSPNVGVLGDAAARGPGVGVGVGVALAFVAGEEAGEALGD
jgi:hypothetical protein